MTRPKKVCPNDVVLITRRTINRQFLLKPEARGQFQQEIAYLFIKYLNQYQLELHALVVMSNHYHMVVTDPHCLRAEFMRDFHRACTRWMNKKYKRTGPLWEHQRPGDSTLIGDDTIIEKMLYTWLNPVKANLVASTSDWKHFSVLPSDWNRPITVRKPQGFHPDWDDSVTLVSSAPEQFETPHAQKLSASDYLRLIAQQEQYYQTRRAHRQVATMQQSFDLDRDESPATPDLNHGTNPRFITKCPHRRRALKRSLAVFEKDYRDAMAAFVEDKLTLFPFGTFNHRVRFGVPLLEPREDDPFLR